MKIKTIKILTLLSFFILFSAFFYNYLSTKLWDFDFWWHIATGRYIVENSHLPESDLFSYTSELEENKNLFPAREAVILKQYWLAQIVFYLVYKAFGDMGMILLRSCILMLVILSVYWGLKKAGVKFYIIFPFVFFVYFTTLTYSGERPVLFTIFFSVLVFLLLDDYKTKRAKTIFLLIPLMLLWANMHGGFVLGNVIIAVFILGETVDIILKRATYTKQELLRFYIATVLSIAVSAINPTGFDPFMIALSPQYNIFETGIQEYQSVFSLYRDKIRSIDIGYIVLVVISPIILILRARKMSLSHILLLSGLLFASISALRFMIYYVLIGAIVFGRETNHLIVNLFEGSINKRMQKVLPGIFAGIILLSSIVYFVGVLKFEGFRFEKATKFSVPEGAVDFIEKYQISGNMFNDFGFGGYLTWRLYPWKKNFIDTRSLNHTLVVEYGWIIEAVESIKGNKLPDGKLPLWKRLIDHYNVNFILIDTLSVQGKVPPLLLRILESDTWVPVYADLISAIFVRNTDKNQEVIKRFRIPKETVYDAMVVRTAQWAMMNENPLYFISLGDIFYNRGMMKDAVTAYEYAIKRMPRNHSLRLKVEEIKRKMESK